MQLIKWTAALTVYTTVYRVAFDVHAHTHTTSTAMCSNEWTAESHQEHAFLDWTPEWKLANECHAHVGRMLRIRTINLSAIQLRHKLPD